MGAAAASGTTDLGNVYLSRQGFASRLAHERIFMLVSCQRLDAGTKSGILSLTQHVPGTDERVPFEHPQFRPLECTRGARFPTIFLAPPKDFEEVETIPAW